MILTVYCIVSMWCVRGYEVNIICKILKKIFHLDIFMKDKSLYYLCNGDALPDTLTEEEEKMYIDMLDDGSEEAKSKLIEHNLRLVVYVAKKFESVGVDMEDLVSIGSFGLIKHPQKGTTFLLFTKSFCQFQISSGGAVKQHIFAGKIGINMPEMLQLRLLCLIQILQ